MKWSWKIGRVAGIGVSVNVTMIILVGWVGANYFLPPHSWEEVASGLGFIVCLFGIVVLHELGHALMAKKFGIRTRDITLLPIGGVARLERIPEDPKQEPLQRQFKTAEPSESAERAFARLPACECHTLPVLHHGKLAGMLTMENLGEFLMIQAALRKERPGLRPTAAEITGGRPA